MPLESDVTVVPVQNGVNLEKYPNDKEKTWSFPAEHDGFVNYCINRLINKNLCSNTTRDCNTFLSDGT